jgi:hypothetical protein
MCDQAKKELYQAKEDATLLGPLTSILLAASVGEYWVHHICSTQRAPNKLGLLAAQQCAVMSDELPSLLLLFCQSHLHLRMAETQIRCASWRSSAPV